MDEWNRYRDELYVNDIHYIPAHQMDQLIDYIEYGTNPGKFITSIICNDLVDAVMYAPKDCINNIPAFANFMYEIAPGSCWGSKENMQRWIDIGGMRGYEEEHVADNVRLSEFMDNLVNQGYLVRYDDGTYSSVNLTVNPDGEYYANDFYIEEGKIIERRLLKKLLMILLQGQFISV